MVFDIIRTGKYRVVPLDGAGQLKLGYVTAGTTRDIAEEDHVCFVSQQDYTNFMTKLTRAKGVSDQKADDVINRLEKKMQIEWRD